MQLGARLIPLFPLALSIVGIVLAALCLFAGHEKGFMENYDIVRLNTSMVGQNVLLNVGDDKSKEDDKDDDDDDGDDDDDEGIFGKIKGKFDDAKDDAKDKIDELKDDAKDKINDIANGVAGDLAEALGISDWYSVHIQAACEGKYEPNATEPSPSLNITNCTTSSPTYKLNFTDILDKQLDLGPLDFNLADLNYPDEIQEKLDIINDLLLGLFIVYVLGMGFSGLAVIGSLAAIFLAHSRLVVLFNFSVSGLAALSMTIGSIIVTIAGTKGVNQLNKVAEDFGIVASRGKNFLIISWVSAAVMIVAALFWTVRFCFVFKERRAAKRSHRKSSI